ncbi:MAG: thioredoxin family protein [Desulfobacteraceae bacterium]|nr:thioredoxin family protein [Desulfobacteraceae bacterium]
MTPEEERKIALWGQKLKNDIPMELTITGDKRSRAFQNFCDSLSRVAPKIRTKTEKEDEAKAPVIRIGNVRYQAIPTGKELEPFLSALAGDESPDRQLPASLRELVGSIEIPARLKIYITPHCPFCPVAVKQLLSLAAANEGIKLTIIDGALFPEAAKSDNIQSAPTVLLDDMYRWTGAIQLSEIADMILNRDPARLSASSLRDMLEEGNAAGVAAMMTDSGKIFPAFLELLVSEKWPVRLGAMVVFETIAEKNNKLIAQAIPFLWERFLQVEETVKGDVLYLFGISGDESLIPKLETVLSGPYPAEVKEAATEALEEISRSFQ